MPAEAIIFIISFGLVIIWVAWDTWKENSKWNDGFCLESGAPWKYATCTPSGKWVYRDGQGHEMWSSYYRKPVRL